MDASSLVAVSLDHSTESQRYRNCLPGNEDAIDRAVDLGDWIALASTASMWAWRKDLRLPALAQRRTFISVPGRQRRASRLWIEDASGFGSGEYVLVDASGSTIESLSLGPGRFLAGDLGNRGVLIEEANGSLTVAAGGKSRSVHSGPAAAVAAFENGYLIVSDSQLLWSPVDGILTTLEVAEEWDWHSMSCSVDGRFAAIGSSGFGPNGARRTAHNTVDLETGALTSTSIPVGYSHPITLWKTSGESVISAWNDGDDCYEVLDSRSMTGAQARLPGTPLAFF
jgi:hypothetical protein